MNMNKLKWGQPENSDLPTPAAFGQLEHAGQRMQPLFTAQQMNEYAQTVIAQKDAEIDRLKSELARPESLVVSVMRAEIAALKQALADIATTEMPGSNDEEHDALHDCIATAQGALHHTSGSPKPLCTACWGEGWEPSVYDGRRPCGHCVPQAVQP